MVACVSVGDNECSDRSGGREEHGDSEGGGMAPEGARDRDAPSPASSDWWRAAATAAAEAARASESAAVPSPCGSSGEAEAAEAEKTEFPSGATTQHGTGMPVEGSRAGT
jgi:hypothetical protein